jgi:hypothetical protein
MKTIEAGGGQYKPLSKVKLTFYIIAIFLCIILLALSRSQYSNRQPLQAYKQKALSLPK